MYSKPAIVFALAALVALASEAKAAPSNDEGFPVFRCIMPDGSRVYARKPVAKADCVVFEVRPNYSDRWEKIQLSNSSPIYFDRESVTRAGSSVAFWADLELRDDRGLGTWRRIRGSISCDDRTMTIIRVIVADSNDPSRFPAEIVIEPETAIEQLMYRLCSSGAKPR